MIKELKMQDRTRLCLTLDLGSSVKIGHDMLTVSAIAERPSFTPGRPAYNEVMLSICTLPKTVWAIEQTEVFLPEYSVLVNEITRGKARIAVHAPQDIKIERVKQ